MNFFHLLKWSNPEKLNYCHRQQQQTFLEKHPVRFPAPDIQAVSYTTKGHQRQRLSHLLRIKDLVVRSRISRSSQARRE